MKITLGEMRETGVHSLIVFCADYRCGHNVTLEPAVVDRWPDHVRLPDDARRSIYASRLKARAGTKAGFSA